MKIFVSEVFFICLLGSITGTLQCLLLRIVAQAIPRKTRGELMKSVDVSYYGNCDEDDGIIVPQEAIYEEKRRF